MKRYLILFLLLSGFIFSDDSEGSSTKMNLLIVSPKSGEPIQKNLLMQTEPPPKNVQIKAKVLDNSQILLWEGELNLENKYKAQWNVEEIPSGQYKFQIEYVVVGIKYIESVDFWLGLDLVDYEKDAVDEFTIDDTRLKNNNNSKESIYSKS